MVKLALSISQPHLAMSDLVEEYQVAAVQVRLILYALEQVRHESLCSALAIHMIRAHRGTQGNAARPHEIP